MTIWTYDVPWLILWSIDCKTATKPRWIMLYLLLLHHKIVMHAIFCIHLDFHHISNADSQIRESYPTWSRSLYLMQTIQYYFEDGRTNIVEKLAGRSLGCTMNVEDVPHIAIPMSVIEALFFFWKNVLDQYRKLLQKAGLHEQCWALRFWIRSCARRATVPVLA